jgi:hypothetical protein
MTNQPMHLQATPLSLTPIYRGCCCWCSKTQGHQVRVAQNTIHQHLYHLLLSIGVAAADAVKHKAIKSGWRRILSITSHSLSPSQKSSTSAMTLNKTLACKVLAIWDLSHRRSIPCLQWLPGFAHPQRASLGHPVTALPPTETANDHIFNTHIKNLMIIT